MQNKPTSNTILRWFPAVLSLLLFPAAGIALGRNATDTSDKIPPGMTHWETVTASNVPERPLDWQPVLRSQYPQEERTFDPPSSWAEPTLAGDPTRDSAIYLPSAARADLVQLGNQAAISELECETCDDPAGTDGSGRKLDSFLQKVEVHGHVRLRHETDLERISRPTRNGHREVKVLVELLDQDGQVVGQGSRSLFSKRTTSLAPGEETPFSLTVRLRGESKPVRGRLLVERVNKDRSFRRTLASHRWSIRER